MDYQIVEIGLDYNRAFAKGFDVELVDINDISAALNESLAHFSGKTMSIYGASTSGRVVFDALGGERIGGFIDMAPAKREFAGLPVSSPRDPEWPDILILAVSPANHLSALKTISAHAPQGMVIAIVWQSEFFDPSIWMQTRKPAPKTYAAGSDGQPRLRKWDNRGAIMFEGDKVYRSITDVEREFYEDLINDKQRMACLHEAGLVNTVRTDRDGCVLQHDLQLNVPYTDWSMSQFKDAALFLLNFWEYLYENGFSTQDSNPENIMFDGNKPVFVDFCSIGPKEAATVSPPFMHNYFSSWVYPLALLDSKQLTFFYEMFEEKLTFDQVKPLLTDDSLQSVTALYAEGKACFDNKDIPGFIAAMRKWIGSVEIVHASMGWNTECYQQQELGAPEPQLHKEHVLDSLYEKFEPETLLDMGCNKGRFSYLAALRGIKSYAFDTAESLIDKLYLFAKERQLPLQAHVVDCANLKPFSEPEFRFDMVAYLALIHHLIFTFGKSVAEIVEQAEGLCERVAAIEYVAPMPNEKFVEDNFDPELYPEYTVEGITAELMKYFDEVEAIDLTPSRILLVASRKDRPERKDD